MFTTPDLPFDLHDPENKKYRNTRIAELYRILEGRNSSQDPRVVVISNGFGGGAGEVSIFLQMKYLNALRNKRNSLYTKFIRQSRDLVSINASKSNRWTSQWIWAGPDWSDINNPDTSAVGFVSGPALPDTTQKALQTFISDLGSKQVNLFTGPLLYQDGSPFLKKGETATDEQIWYMKQLLQGMGGQSSTK